MSSQALQGEIQHMAEKLLWKLKQMPQADPLEIIAFVIILIFIGVVLLMVIVACSHCCCISKRHRVKPNPGI